MCIRYSCKTCSQPCILYCESVDIYTSTDPGCTLPCTDPAPNARKRCPTCTTILGVTTVLTNLVFQNPWLETEGMAGLETLPEWEINPDLLFKKRKSIWSAGYVEAKDTIVKKIEEMGLGGLEGRDVLNEGEAWDDDETVVATGGLETTESAGWGGSEGGSTVEGENDEEEEKEEEERGEGALVGLGISFE